MLFPETTLEMVWGTRQSWNLNCIVPGTNPPVPFDITLYDLIFTVKIQPTDTDPGVFQLTIIAGVPNGIVITNAVGGLAVGTVLPAQTEQLPQAELRASWDLRLTATNDATNSQIIARGPFLIHPAVGSATDV